MSAEGLTWDAAVGIATGIPAGLLGVAGVQHVLGDDRRPLGVAELAAATLGVVALVVPGLLLADVVIFGALAVAFLVRLARLWRTDRARPCGCTPFSTSVTRLSFLPAATLLATALLAAAAHAGASDTRIDAERLVLFLISALLGWSILLWPAAAEG